MKFVPIPRIVSWPRVVLSESVTDGASPAACSSVRAQTPEVGVRDGGDRHRNCLHVALAGLPSCDDGFLADADAQGEGHEGPAPSQHLHMTTSRLESGQFCRDCVGAFGKVEKREVAGGTGLRLAVDDAPHRHPRAWDECPGLVVD